jgi:hypothetical protein
MSRHPFSIQFPKKDEIREEEGMEKGFPTVYGNRALLLPR